MADRYLLESGAPDGYLLEDGSGVLLLEVSATVYTYAPSGGAISGGATTLSKTKAYPVSGGATTSGAAALSKTKDYPASGGAVASGSAALAKTKDYPVSGGAITSGAAQTSLEAVAVRGPVFRRVIVLPRAPTVFAYRAQGGIRARGAAETSLTRVPARAYVFQGRAGRRIRGQASVAHFDMGAHIRRLDDEFLLLAA